MRISSFMTATVLLSGSLAAQADSVDVVDHFTFTSGINTAEFSIPLPAMSLTALTTIANFRVPLTLNGITADFPSESFLQSDGDPSDFQLNFYVGSIHYDIIENGPNLFTGSSQNPIFYTGFTSVFESGDTLSVIQSVTTPLAPTPEPSSIALLDTGLLGAVGVARKRFAS